MTLSATQCVIFAGAFPAFLLAHVLDKGSLVARGRVDVGLVQTYAMTLGIVGLGFGYAVGSAETGASGPAAFAIIGSAVYSIAALAVGSVVDAIKLQRRGETKQQGHGDGLE